MPIRSIAKLLGQLCLAGGLCGGLVSIAPGAEPNSGGEEIARATAVETNSPDLSSRSWLQLQAQIHSALLAIDQNRQEAEAAARLNSETVATRLKMLEQTFTAQREREMELIQSSNRFIMIATAVFGSLGLLTSLFISWFLFRAMNRFSQLTAAFPASSLGAGPASVPSLVLPNAPELAGRFSLTDASSSRLLAAIARLEKQMEEVDRLAKSAPSPGALVSGSEQDPAAIEREEHLSGLLGKGQTLLNLDRPEEAIGCFNEVIVFDPKNSEALVKKGVALERLRKLEEAIECYDQAIAANSSSTLAYLYKGGVFNQLERFSDALQCYEQALRSQQKAVLT